MDEPGNGAGDRPASGDDRTDSLERLLAIVGPRIDELRSLLGDSTQRWRGDALRAGEGTRHRLRDLFRDLGLVTREDWDELELRVAQVEHRLSLLERAQDQAEPRP